MTARMVVTGIIDDGIAFAHARFRKANESRVEYWWLQDGDFKGQPADFGFGHELRKSEIDDLIGDCTRAGIVDEDELYARAGLLNFRRDSHQAAAWRAAHGTHMLDLACGFDPQTAPGDRPIVAVQLPWWVTANASGGDLTPYALAAMDYIVARAKAIASAPGSDSLAVVINFSYGKFAGPHDGTYDLELAIDDLVDRCAAEGVPVRVVLPAGNSYLSRCHAQTSFSRRTEVKTFRWRLLPDDQTPSYLEIWMPCFKSGPSSRLELTITPPGGPQKSIAEGDAALQVWGTPPQEYATAGYNLEPGPAPRGRFLLALAPTASHDPAVRLAPAGVWTIELRLKNTGLDPSDVVHAWIERDDSTIGYPVRGRQSHFDDDRYRRYDDGGRDIEIDDPSCYVWRAGTLNAFATGKRPIVMGAFLRKEMMAAKYSAGGPTQAACGSSGAEPYRPDALAVSEDSKVHAGVLAAGSRSGSVVPMTGTSVAAPQVTRWIAGELAAGRDGDRQPVRDEAARQERANPTRPPIPPDPPQPDRYGAGRIELDPIVRPERYWK